MNFILPLDLEILQTKILEASLHTPKMIASACRKFSYLSAGKRTTSSSTFFWKYSKDVQTSYFGYSGHAHPRWQYQLVKNLMFLSMPKINFIIHFFLWRITGELKFCQICDWWWNININTSFHFKIFPGKLVTRFFNKKSNNPYFRTILGIFLSHLPENELFWKKRALTYHGAKNLEKLTVYSWQKCRKADGQTDRQKTDF